MSPEVIISLGRSLSGGNQQVENGGIKDWGKCHIHEIVTFQGQWAYPAWRQPARRLAHPDSDYGNDGGNIATVRPFRYVPGFGVRCGSVLKRRAAKGVNLAVFCSAPEKRL
jgi:hypothetical protein